MFFTFKFTRLTKQDSGGKVTFRNEGLRMRLVNQLKMQVTQPNDNLSKVLMLEEGKRKRCDLLQNGATYEWVKQELK